MSSSSNASRNHTVCEVVLGRALRKDQRIRLLAESIQKSGCPIPAKFFSCAPCKSDVLAHFSPSSGVTVCENALISQTDSAVAAAVAHELIHAYDYCNADVKFDNCLHHACSEIRAANLSGECKLTFELLRGKPKFFNGMPDCVKRRALKSVQMNENCIGDRGEKAVEAAWDRCSKSLEPFDHLP